MDKFGPKPLTDANLVTEFGGVEDMEQFKQEGPFRNDMMYVPGFSDMRYKRDCELSDLARGDIKAKEVSVLEWNCRWYRCTSGKGNDPDNSRVISARNEGYKPATKDDIGKPWLTELPPGAYIAPDGVIKNSGEDLALFVCDQANAAKNAMRKKILTEEMVDGMDMSPGGLGAIGKSHKGADPVVTKEAHK